MSKIGNPGRRVLNASILNAGSLALALSILAVPQVVAQELIPRVAPPQMTLQEMQALPASDRVVVKLREGRQIRLSAGQLTGLSSSEQTFFAAALQGAGVDLARMTPLFERPAAELDAARADAEIKSGRQLADLNLYVVLEVPEGASAAEVADRLNELDMVEFAEPAPVPAPAPVDISPTTPKFTGQQGYKGPAPTGINLPSSQDYPGVGGGGTAVVDVEYSWQLDHEDLEIPPDRQLVANPVDPFSSTNHGTAVLGEIVGKKNAYGVTGIAPASKAYVAAANTSSGYNPANAINAAAAELKAGDVIVIEQQYWACGSGPPSSIFGPLEWLQSVFDATAQATAAGIIVVAAAGNGSINLDDSSCLNRFNTAVRDSGAIIVGAGSPNDRSRLSFSSFGSRLDAQGWGQSVTTTGYGSLFNGGNDIRQRYTAGFNGTSSATPIVAGAILAIQGRRKACGLAPATPAEIRQILASTGTPQGNPGGGLIGPLPNVLAAMEEMDLLTCGEPEEPDLLVTPGGEFRPKGPEGGPFAPARKRYTLTNEGGESLEWRARKNSTWLRMVPKVGTLEAGESVLVKAIVRKRASELAARNLPYKAKIFFLNETNGMGDTERAVKLKVTGN